MKPITLDTPTKTDFTNAFNELTKFGYNVKNFNSKRKMGSGAVGFVDHMITGNGHLVFVEVKIGADKLRPAQKDFAEKIMTVVNKNNTVKYWQISKLSEAMGIVDYLAEHCNG